MEKFKVGEYIIYVNGDRYELGIIKRLTEDGAFICYHEGETAAKTPYDLIHKLINGFTIKDTIIGGEVFKALEQKSILEKIRSKFENHCGLAKENHCKYCSYCNSLMGVREILETIDKYKAESEGE